MLLIQTIFLLLSLTSCLLFFVKRFSPSFYNSLSIKYSNSCNTIIKSNDKQKAKLHLLIFYLVLIAFTGMTHLIGNHETHNFRLELYPFVGVLTLIIFLASNSLQETVSSLKFVFFKYLRLISKMLIVVNLVMSPFIIINDFTLSEVFNYNLYLILGLLSLYLFMGIILKIFPYVFIESNVWLYEKLIKLSRYLHKEESDLLMANLHTILIPSILIATFNYFI